MKPLLVILNPRLIPSAMTAFKALKISKAWISFYPENRVFSECMPRVIADAKAKGYTHILLTSDDVIVMQEALDRVLAFPEGVKACSGWVNLCADGTLSNVSQIDLQWNKQPTSSSGYEFERAEAVRAREVPFHATFSGFALLRLLIEVWEAVDTHACSWSSCTDFWVYTRLRELGVPLWVDPRAFCLHLKQVSDEANLDCFYVGSRTPHIRWEEDPGE
jgi:hypothetical protein